MSVDPNFDGPFAPVRFAAGDEPPVWPVLARLPLVAVGEAASSERLPTYAALEQTSPAASGVRTPAPLRVVQASPVVAPADRATTHYATRVDPPQFRGQTIVVGPNSTPARAPGWLPVEEASPPAELISPPAPPRRAQYRIDVAEDRFQGSRSARRQADDSLAARVARRHAAAAPYAGVAVTAALIIAASLLYGLTVGRQSAIGGDELVDPQNSWSSEAPIAPPVSAAVAPTESELATPIDEVDSLLASPESPRVADAAAAAPEATKPETIEPAAPAADGPALGTGAEPSPSTAAIEPAIPVVPAPLAAMPITPTPNDSPYPTTDYPWFEFGLPQATGGAAPATADNAAMGGAPGQERAQ